MVRRMVERYHLDNPAVPADDKMSADARAGALKMVDTALHLRTGGGVDDNKVYILVITSAFTSVIGLQCRDELVLAIIIGIQQILAYLRFKNPRLDLFFLQPAD